MNFFRRVRRKLAFENKPAAYSRYAVGEVILIVVGILIALQVSSWTEERKRKQEREILVNDLISDFQLTLSRATDATLEAQTIDRNIQNFMKFSMMDHLEISFDSIRSLADFGFAQVRFQPALSSYETAIATGSIALLKSRALSEAFSEFKDAHESYLQHVDLAGQMVYLGSWWEIRKKLGSLHAIGNRPFFLPERFELTETEYKEFISQKEVYAAFENMQWIYRNYITVLLDLENKVRNVLHELNHMH